MRLRLLALNLPLFTVRSQAPYMSNSFDEAFLKALAYLDGLTTSIGNLLYVVNFKPLCTFVISCKAGELFHKSSWPNKPGFWPGKRAWLILNSIHFSLQAALLIMGLLCVCVCCVPACVSLSLFRVDTSTVKFRHKYVNYSGWKANSIINQGVLFWNLTYFDDNWLDIILNFYLAKRWMNGHSRQFSTFVARRGLWEQSDLLTWAQTFCHSTSTSSVNPTLGRMKKALGRQPKIFQCMKTLLKASHLKALNLLSFVVKFAVM